MKSRWIGCALVCLLSVSGLAQAPVMQYQSGKIVAVEKLEAHSHASAGTDAPSEPSAYSYDVSIQVGDIVYRCRYQEDTGELASWLQGKEVQVRIKSKTMYVKRATGKDAKASILRTSNAGKG